MDNLKLFAKHLIQAEKYLSQSIESKDGEIYRLESFEKNFQSMKDKYCKFKELIDKNDKTRKELKSRLQKDFLQHKKKIEELKSQIVQLNQMIDESIKKNHKLESEYMESIRLFQHYKNGQANGFSNGHNNSTIDCKNTLNHNSSLIDSYAKNDYHNLSSFSSTPRNQLDTSANYSTTSPIVSSSLLPHHLPSSLSSLTFSSLTTATATPISNRNSSNCKSIMQWKLGKQDRETCRNSLRHLVLSDSLFQLNQWSMTIDAHLCWAARPWIQIKFNNNNATS